MLKDKISKNKNKLKSIKQIRYEIRARHHSVMFLS
jgi:hypothetical protein